MNFARLDFDDHLTSDGMSLQGLQVAALDAAKRVAARGGVVFLTGKAGTGKSAVVKAIRELFSCLVVAPTGLAATNVRGATIHSTFGIRPGVRTDAWKMPLELPDIWAATDLIIVDEISMVRADLLDQVDFVCRFLASNDKPFGGKGVLLVGDFWQIEPVVTKEDEPWLDQGGYLSPFAFSSRVWKAAEPEKIELDYVWRQASGPFLDALNDLRQGGSNMLDVFNARVDKAPDDDVLRLCFRNRRADERNLDRLAALPGPVTDFVAVSSGDWDCRADGEPSPRKVLLKVGARVMLTKNSKSLGLVNGDMGTVEGFQGQKVLVRFDGRGAVTEIKKSKWSKSKFRVADTGELDEIETGSFHQVPLKLAWGVTAHKSQGQTYSRVHLEMDGRAFCHGLAYVALSRARSLEGLSLGREITSRDVQVSPIVSAFLNPRPALDFEGL